MSTETRIFYRPNYHNYKDIIEHCLDVLQTMYYYFTCVDKLFTKIKYINSFTSATIVLLLLLLC